MTGFASLSFAPALPWPVLAGLALIALAVLAVALWRRAAGTGWRALALSALLLALADPSLVEERRRTLPDVAALVVDRSPSQDLGERAVRTAEAAAALGAKLAEEADLELRVVEAGAGEDASGDAGSRLFTALERALSDVPRGRRAGAIIVTDGQVHDAPEGAAAKAIGGPVHVLLSGERGEADRRIVVVRAPRYGIVGQELDLTLRVEDDAPGGKGAGAVVRLRRQGGKPVEYRLGIGLEETIPFVLDRGGSTVIEMEAAAGPSEITLRNNRAVTVVHGVRDRLRVLLVSGKPHAGERTWRNLLKADPSVDLVHFTILRPPRKQDGTPINELSLIAFPIRQLFEVKLDEFDLIIFDRYRRRGVLPQVYLRNVADYVVAGGAILEAAGPAFASPLSLYRTPLARVLPGAPTGQVIERGFRPGLTALGRRHPVTADLPGAGAAGSGVPGWGRWFRMIEADAARGDTLMTGVAGKPVLILDRVGEGRVAQLLSDHAWLWGRGFEGGGPQAELLRRLAHWLMKEPDLEEEDLRATAQNGRLEITRRSLGGDFPPVTVRDPAGNEVEVTLERTDAGRARGGLAVSEPGLYRLSDGVRSAVAAVGALNPREFADVRTTADIVAPVAAATGGAVAWLTESGVPAIRRVRPGRDTAGRGWIGLVANRDYLVTGLRQADLMPPLVLLALALGGLAFAWYREGR